MTFEALFSAIHGYPPFPWQSKAAAMLVSGTGRLSVSVPTACGKTALIDAAVYAACRGGARRIAFIVNRRAIVDEAYTRAQKLAAAMAAPGMADIAKRLGPIQVVRLTGGVHDDDDWVLYPDRLTILVTTIDRIGSRLLHRGYGVSPRMAPMHAGFVGNESLFILDEAPVAAPFIETVAACRRHGADVRLVTLTATPQGKSPAEVSLSADDRRHPVLARRLAASKMVAIKRFHAAESTLEREAAAAAERLSKPGGIVAIIVNQLAAARQIWSALTKKKRPAVLLTGRLRPFDRDRLMDRIFPAIRAGGIRISAKPLFVVTTQAVEAGADVDFDAVVTEAASLEALIQRFGRQDRLGRLGISHGLILVPRERKPGRRAAAPPDPVYGDEIGAALAWLERIGKNGCIDFGTLAMEKALDNVPFAVPGPRHAPVLLPSHLALLCQTGPDAPPVHVSPWLHGAGRGGGDVTVIWRADIFPEDESGWIQAIRLRPPLNREAVEIPAHAVRSWLRGERSAPVHDVEGTAEVPSIADDTGRTVLRWRGTDDVEVIPAGKIGGGDTIILPAAYGGYDVYGWNPKRRKPVSDVAEACSLEKRREHVVRLVPGLTRWLGSAEETIAAAVREIQRAETHCDPEQGVNGERIRAGHKRLRQLLEAEDQPLTAAFRHRYTIELHPHGAVLRARMLEDIGGTLNGGVKVPLDVHLEGVARKVESIAGRHRERERMARAARRHDIGKIESRFQFMLHGDPFSAAEGPVLAKSGLDTHSQIRASYFRSGLPEGFRHELASVHYSSEADELVRYLIASHHGFGRPWFPDCTDRNAPGGRLLGLDSGWLASFSSLLKDHTIWGLAGMELLLRVADTRQSRAEQEAENDGVEGVGGIVAHRFSGDNGNASRADPGSEY